MRTSNGSLRKRSNGTWEYRVYVDGKRVSAYGETKASAIAAYEKNIKSDFKPKGKTTVSEWAERWLSIYKKGKVAHGTYLNYELYTRKYICSEIGARQLSGVLPADIELLFSSPKVRSLSKSAQRHIYLCLQGLFQTALDNGLIQKSPVKKKRIQADEAEAVKVFQADEIAKIIQAAKTHRYGHIVLLLLYTGARAGELCALKWEDIDGDTLTIRRASAFSENGYAEKSTKSGRERTVYLTDEAKELIAALPKETEYILSCDGKPYYYDKLHRHYQTFFKETGLPYLSPHKCRHTYATFLVQSGAGILFVRELLGHSSVRTTEIYAHANKAPLKEAARKLKYNL